MATYRELVGKNIKILSSDPSTGMDGEVWYNSTKGTLRGLGAIEAWVSSSALTTARYNPGGGGDSTAALIFGGYTGTAQSTATEEYNGSGWATGPVLGTARSGVSGTGTVTAGLSVGGVNPPSTYNSTTLTIAA